MGLYYNIDTAVSKPINMEYREDVSFLNAEDISRDIQPQNRIFNLSVATASSPLVYTITEEVILTMISYDFLIYGGGVYNAGADLKINGSVIDSSTCGNLAGTKVFLQKNTPLPNIRLKVGEIITLTATKTAGSSGDANIYLIGFYA